LTTVDKFCIRAYTALGGKLTVHEWKHEFDPAFGAVVAKSRCGRILDRRVLIQVVTSQPLCKRCEQLRAAENKATEVREVAYSPDEKKASPQLAQLQRRSAND
jgi:hypothetical protein